MNKFIYHNICIYMYVCLYFNDNNNCLRHNRYRIPFQKPGSQFVLKTIL